VISYAFFIIYFWEIKIFNHNPDIKTYLMWSAFIIIELSVVWQLLFHIYKLYNRDNYDEELNETIKAFLKTLFGEDKNNKELMASHYKLRTYLNVIKNENDSYIVFGKLDREAYWQIYTQFCYLADEILWTKNKSLMRKEEIEHIYSKYSDDFTTDNLCTKFTELNKSYTTLYDDEFLKSSAIKKRVLVIDKFDKSNLDDCFNFLEMIGTDKKVLNKLKKQKNKNSINKRLRHFIGDSMLCVVEKQELCDNFSIKESETEFGVYRISDTLYALKTEENIINNETTYNITIEVEHIEKSLNSCNLFFKKLMNTKKIDKYDIKCKDGRKIPRIHVIPTQGKNYDK
jgi:hypothetical protein